MTSRPPRPRRVRGSSAAAALAIAVVACVSACGRSGSSTGAVPSTTTTTRGSAAAPAPPGELPQTHDRPTLDAAFHQRIDALWKAVVDDRPDEALASFFPLAAYLQVKDVRDPGRDWQDRLVGSYDSIIHRLHRRLATSTATHPEVSVPESKAVWVEPGVEHNKIGYWRVYHSRVAADGRSFFIATMISWRGSWYVVHLAKVA